MEKAKTMTQVMAESRTAFVAVVKSMEVQGWEYKGVTEKGLIFSDAEDHFVTVSVTAHKWETDTTEAYDGLGMLEQYEDKQRDKVAKKAEAEVTKAKKVAEKEKAKAAKVKAE